MKLEFILIRHEFCLMVQNYLRHSSVTTKPQSGADRYLLSYEGIYFPWKYFCHWLICTSGTSRDMSWFCRKNRILSQSRSAPTTLYVQWNIVNTTDVNIRRSVKGWSKEKTTVRKSRYLSDLSISFLSFFLSFFLILLLRLLLLLQYLTSPPYNLQCFPVLW